MRAFIIYDSWFGNTEKIAQAIAGGMPENSELINIHGGSYPELDLNEEDILIVGGPTQKFGVTPEVVSFIKSLPKMKNSCAAFDTRISLDVIESKALRFAVEKGGYAAEKIHKRLRKKKAIPLLPPEGFIVLGEQGPLKDNELERAREWGRKLLEIASAAK
jgi:flavodoxin